MDECFHKATQEFEIRLLRKTKKKWINWSPTSWSFRNWSWFACQQSRKFLKNWIWTTILPQNSSRECFSLESQPQPSFNKEFDLLVHSFCWKWKKRGLRNYPDCFGKMRNRLTALIGIFQGIGSNDSNSKYASWITGGDWRIVNSKIACFTGFTRPLRSDFTDIK